MTIYYGGAPFAARAIYQEAQADVRHLSPVAMLVLLLVVILAFRDPVGVALTVGSVAFVGARRASAAWAGGARASPSPARRCR